LAAFDCVAGIINLGKDDRSVMENQSFYAQIMLKTSFKIKR